MTVNRRGRKRKSGRRTASGALARPQVDYRAMAEDWPHRKSLPEALRASELAESEIGRLCLVWRIHEAKNANERASVLWDKPVPGITDEQFEAGRQFYRIVEAHRSAISAPRGSCGNGQGRDCNPSQCRADKVSDPTTSCRCERHIKRYLAATTALQLKGQAVYNVTYRTAVSDEPCQEPELDDLRTGLSALARHLGV